MVRRGDLLPGNPGYLRAMALNVPGAHRAGKGPGILNFDRSYTARMLFAAISCHDTPNCFGDGGKEVSASYRTWPQ